MAIRNDLATNFKPLQENCASILTTMLFTWCLVVVSGENNSFLTAVSRYTAIRLRYIMQNSCQIFCFIWRLCRGGRFFCFVNWPLGCVYWQTVVFWLTRTPVGSCIIRRWCSRMLTSVLAGEWGKSFSKKFSCENHGSRHLYKWRCISLCALISLRMELKLHPSL